MSGTEFFFTDDSGKKQDAALHADLLDVADADTTDRLISIAAHVEAGGTIEKGQELHGSPATLARLKAEGLLP